MSAPELGGAGIRSLNRDDEMGAGGLADIKLERCLGGALRCSGFSRHGQGFISFVSPSDFHYY